VYAVYHQVAVTSINGFGSPSHVQLHVTDTTDFYDGNSITCYGITGTSGANVTEDNFTTKGSGKIDLTNLLLSGGDPRGTGACSYIGLEFSPTGHTTGLNGVEIKGTSGSPDPTQTLVGLVYATASGSSGVHDTATQRDVASWLNPQPKKMLVPCGAGATTAITYKTPSIVCEGEFVAFGPPGSPGIYPVPQVSWTVNAAVKNSFLAGTEGTSLCFGTTTRLANSTCTAETEESFSTQAVANDYQQATVHGATTTLTEGRNFADLAGFCTGTAPTCTYNASHSSIEVNVAQ
jgi:hypothetical protein